MTRIEWTRLGGDEVEAVVAMLVNRERPNSIRITPSRGDGGVDILDRGGAEDGRDEVHQVKRYTAPLSSPHKREVEKSLKALTADPRWSTLDVGTWYFVTPWNPSPEAEAWLRGLGDKYGLRPVWRGLDYVEQLAAKYPDVVDYYLRGGKARVQEAYESLQAMFSLDKLADDELDVPAFTARVESAMRAVNTDPHYRYEIRLGEGELPEPVGRPGLAMTWMQGKVNGGPWVAVDVIARCAASSDERPITVKGVIKAEAGSEFETAVRDFLAYGAPLVSPYGAYTGEMDAPGGLGGKIADARVKLVPVGDEVGESPNVRIEVLAPGGEVVQSVELRRTQRTGGRDGMRVVLEEINGVFEVEDRYNLVEKTGSRQISFRDLEGKPVASVMPALRFLEACRAPNSARISRAHAPAVRGLNDPNWAFEWDDDMRAQLDGELRVLELLETLQAQTDRVLHVPGADLERARLKEWVSATRLLAGEEVRVTYPEGQSLRLVVDEDAPIVSGTFGMNTKTTVKVGEEEVVIEGVQAWFHDAEVISHQKWNGQSVFEVITPDRVVRYRIPQSVDG